MLTSTLEYYCAGPGIYISLLVLPPDWKIANCNLWTLQTSKRIFWKIKRSYHVLLNYESDFEISIQNGLYTWFAQYQYLNAQYPRDLSATKFGFIVLESLQSLATYTILPSPRETDPSLGFALCAFSIEFQGSPISEEFAPLSDLQTPDSKRKKMMEKYVLTQTTYKCMSLGHIFPPISQENNL